MKLIRNKENLLVAILRGKSEFAYPGEALERTLVQRPEKKWEILEDFIDYLSFTNEKTRKEMVNNPKYFNSDQIEKFVEGCDYSIKALLLKYYLTEEFMDLDTIRILNGRDYVYFVKYYDLVYPILEAEETKKAQKLLSENFRFLFQYRWTIGKADMLNHTYQILNALVKSKEVVVPKEYKSIFRELAKMTDRALKAEECDKLVQQGWNLLDIRRMNLLAIQSHISGRVDTAKYEYLRQIFFGNIPLTDEDKQIMRYLNLKQELDRKINDEKQLVKAVTHYKSFEKDSCNMPYVLDEMENEDVDLNFWLFEHIGIYDEVFYECEKNIQRKIIKEKLEHISLDKVQEMRELFWFYRSICHVDALSKKCLINLYEKNILNTEEINLLNVSNRQDLFFHYIKKPTKKALVYLKEVNVPENTLYVSYANRYHNEVSFIYCVQSDKEPLSDVEVRELYALKEDMIFKQLPEHYVDFLMFIIQNTGEIIHTKAEWRELFDTEMDMFPGYYQGNIKKILWSEEEIAAEKDKQKQQKMEAQKKEWLDTINNINDIKDAKAFSVLCHLESQSQEVIVAACKKFIEGRFYHMNIAEEMVSIYVHGKIDEELLLEYLRDYKVAKKKEKEREE